MTHQGQPPLKTVYQNWSSERLIHAATAERDQYEPEAQNAIMDELSSRGFSKEDVTSQAASASKSIRTKQRNTLLFPASLARTGYLVRFLIFIIAYFLAVIALTFIPGDKTVIGTTLAILFIFYKLAAHDVPRIRNAGFNPFLLLLYIVPAANLALVVFLLVAPPKKDSFDKAS